jgi:hypothetical protein
MSVATVALLSGLAPWRGQAQSVAPPASLTTQVLVTITPGEGGETRVQERFVGVGDSIVQRPRFRALTRSCASVQDVQLRDSAGSVPLSAGAPVAWVEYRESLGTHRNPAPGFELRYVVRGGGSTRDVPLILPAHPVPRTEGMREGNVTVLVESPSAQVRFPQLTRDARTGTWRGHFVAIPSFVRLTTTDGADTPCKAVTTRGDDGGLVWRFGILVAILVAWVPLYLAWARRATSADA